MASAMKGQQADREAVAKLNIAHESAAKISSLQRVVREHASFFDAFGCAFKKGINIKNTLAGKAARAENVHIKLAAATAVWVAAALRSEEMGKAAAVSAAQLRCDARVDNAIARADDIARLVYNGRV